VKDAVAESVESLIVAAPVVAPATTVKLAVCAPALIELVVTVVPASPPEEKVVPLVQLVLVPVAVAGVLVELGPPDGDRENDAGGGGGDTEKRAVAVSVESPIVARPGVEPALMVRLAV
jgi:hypothetical protein